MWRVTFTLLSSPMTTITYDVPGAVTDFERVYDEALSRWAALSQQSAFSCCLTGIVWEQT